MRKYWIIAKNSLQEYFTYRLNFALEVVGGVLFTLVTVWLWRAVVAGRGGIGEYTTAELVTYLIGAGIITSYYFLTAQGDEINDDINRGFASSLLTKPFSPLINWFVRDQARKLLTLSIGAAGFSIVAFFYRDFLVPPATWGYFLAFLAFIVVAAILHFFLYTVFALIAFWAQSTWGERFLLRVVSELASGILIPLTLLPPWLQQFTQFLPFRFFAFVPMQLYLGKLDGQAIFTEFLLLLGWIVFLGWCVAIVWRRGLRVYSGEGI